MVLFVLVTVLSVVQHWNATVGTHSAADINAKGILKILDCLMLCVVHLKGGNNCTNSKRHFAQTGVWICIIKSWQSDTLTDFQLGPKRQEEDSVCFGAGSSDLSLAHRGIHSPISVSFSTDTTRSTNWSVVYLVARHNGYYWATRAIAQLPRYLLLHLSEPQICLNRMISRVSSKTNSSRIDDHVCTYVCS